MLNKKIKEVDYKKRDNQLPNSEVKRGAAASEKMLAELEIKAMREWYVTISKYLISRLPIDDDILKHLENLHPLIQHQHGTTKRLKKLIAAVPHILTDLEVDSALEEWIVYTHEDIPENWYLKEQATDKTTGEMSSS